MPNAQTSGAQQVGRQRNRARGRQRLSTQRQGGASQRAFNIDTEIQRWQDGGLIEAQDVAAVRRGVALTLNKLGML
jgi:hypothetical protein